MSDDTKKGYVLEKLVKDKGENGFVGTNSSQYSTFSGVIGDKSDMLDCSEGGEKSGEGQRRTKSYPAIKRQSSGEPDRGNEPTDKGREEGKNEINRTLIGTGEQHGRKSIGTGHGNIEPQKRLHADICYVEGVRAGGGIEDKAGKEPISGIRTIRKESEHTSELSGFDSEQDKEDITDVIKMISDFAPIRALSLRSKRDRSKVLARANDALELFFKKIGLF